ncbi:class I SAM-dependent methyltransferase [Ktedonosporobacter rubrisoli]|uniref:Class I SAM-dependent methyltransferase n=1 Tax=Ktedonosporobacter rubrisoli TaxID=2509675 RepID=A0A4V0YZA0_KTERU|nr:class I SAM-dependent methyltransferase [Ktedonosporobacter rubrisoli]QBD78991.1 class I SAM-dependent methyltransferase [Ktedonosporobacter rubrisoli]
MHDAESKVLTRETFDAIFAADPNSPTRRRIWREVYGSDYSEEVDQFSFTTLPLLRRIAKALCVGPGQVFADLGCGRGGPGLWVARETGASLTGIDFSQVALEHARQRAELFGVKDRATFLLRDYAKTELPDACFDAVMCVDAFRMAPTGAAVAREILRLLRPGRCFVATVFVGHRPGETSTPSGPEQIFTDAGGVVEVIEPTPDFQPRRLAIYEGMLAEQEALKAELGEQVAELLLKEARMGRNPSVITEQMFVVVRRP